MKKHYGIIALAALIALAAGCTRENTFRHEIGSPIAFGASTGYENGKANTRTEYSGEIVGEGTKYERINWVVETDRIRILCEEVSNDVKFADYDIKTATNTTGESNSIATVKPATENVLAWGAPTADHYFYALYPAATQTGVTAAEAKLEPAAGHKATVTGLIPAEQTPTWDSENRTYKPDMKYAYMYAATKVNPSVTEEVYLPFKPLMNAYEFTFKALSGNPPTANLVSVRLSSSSSNMSGAFSATLSDNGLDELSVSDAGSFVSASLGDGVMLNDNPVKITILALAVAQTNMTLELGFADGSSRSLVLSTTDNGPVSLNPGQKLYITNVGVPAGVQWEYTLGSLQDVTVTYTGTETGSLANAFVSYRTKGSTTEAVPFTLEYSEDDGTTWSETPPSWITPDSGIDYGGSVSGLPLGVAVAAQENTVVDEHHNTLAAMSSPEPYFDLSTINVADGRTVLSTTANCYVVHAPGTYKFPLVYGNGVKDGGPLESAYRAKAGVNATEYRPDDGESSANPNNPSELLYFLGRYKDHLDANITSPYIGVQHAGKSLSAVLVWEDAQGLVTDCNISDTGKDAYLTFNVPQENITQGNALVAVLVDGVIAWSWHIWVTEEDLTNLKAGANTSVNPRFAPVNIGWCEGKMIEKYEARSCRVRAKQAVSGAVSTAVSVMENNAEFYTRGNGPYYQYGRKDPLQASDGYGHNKVYYYYFPATEAMMVQSGRVSLGTGIQHPQTFFTYSGSWYVGAYLNLWSSTVNGEGFGNAQDPNGKQKTIYDPSPSGFRIPSKDELTGFNLSNFPWKAVANDDKTGNNGREYEPSGLFLPATGLRRYNNGVVSGESGVYWPSIPYKENYGYYLDFSATGMTTFGSSFQGWGMVIRPVAE